jgi:hypothetical protein
MKVSDESGATAISNSKHHHRRKFWLQHPAFWNRTSFVFRCGSKKVTRQPGWCKLTHERWVSIFRFSSQRAISWPNKGLNGSVSRNMTMLVPDAWLSMVVVRSPLHILPSLPFLAPDLSTTTYSSRHSHPYISLSLSLFFFFSSLFLSSFPVSTLPP